MGSALNIMQDINVSEIDDGIDQLRVSMILTIVYLGCILFLIIAFCCTARKLRTNNCCRNTLFGVAISVELLSVTIVSLAFIGKGKFDEKAETLTALDNAVQGCMDKYSDISEVEISEQLIRPAEEATTAANVLAAFGIIILFKILLAICMSCIIRSKSKKPVA